MAAKEQKTPKEHLLACGGYSFLLLLFVFLNGCTYVPDWADPVSLYDRVFTGEQASLDPANDIMEPPSLIAPPTFVVETCQYAHQRPDEHGYMGHTWHLPVHGCRMIRTGNDYEFIRPVLPDDQISVTWTLEDIIERKSSLGGSQLFVTSVARYYDIDNELIAVNRETLVYQPLKESQ